MKSVNEMNIAKIMTPKVFTVLLHEDNTVRQGYELMKEKGYTAIPVLDSGERYAGAVTEGDFLRFLMDMDEGSCGLRDTTKIGHIMRRNFCRPIHIDADEDAVINAIIQQNFVPVVDSQEALCGIVTRRKLIEYLAGRLD